MELLTGPFWLNDQIIAFYFQYLESDKYEEDDRILFVSPQVTQLLKLSDPDDCRVLLEPLFPDEKRVILFAVNDNNSSAAGGTHWSLLVFSRGEDTFFSFDSMNNLNHSATKKLVHILQKGLSRPFAELQRHDCTQQANGYDCGVHVLCNAETVCDHYLNSGAVRNTPRISVYNKRRDILRLIVRLGGRITDE